MTAHVRITGPIVVAKVGEAVATHGIPGSILTDNGMVFTTRLSGGKGGRERGRVVELGNRFVDELEFGGVWMWGRFISLQASAGRRGGGRR